MSKTLGPGVTADSIKLGISLIDLKCIQQFINFTRPNQQAVYQAFIDDVNKKGGINGRKIVADFRTECPLTSTSDLLVQVCTQFTDDDKVFAVMGNLSDAAQDAAIHTCIAKKHNTPGDDLRPDAGDDRPGAARHDDLPGHDPGAVVGRAVRADAEAEPASRARSSRCSPRRRPRSR